MLLTSVHIDGLRNGPDHLDLVGPIVHLPRPPAGVAVADALALCTAVMAPERANEILAGLGIAHPGGAQVEIDDQNDIQVRRLLPDAVRATLEHSTRQIHLQLTVTMDPPLFAHLRQQAVRDPWLVDAIAAGGELRLRIGWLFTQDYSVGAGTLLGIDLGETPLRPPGGDRPGWLRTLVSQVGARIALCDPDHSIEGIAKRIHEATLSPDPAVRNRARRLHQSMNEPPFAFGTLELVSRDGTIVPTFGQALLPARCLGPATTAGLRLAEAAVLTAPDVLVVHCPGEPGLVTSSVEDWLLELTKGPDATLEQVLIVPGHHR